MFRALSQRMLTPPRLSFRRVDSSGKNSNSQTRIELSTASKKGKTHDNEDRTIAIANLVPPVQLPSDAGPSNRAFDLSDVKYLAVFDGHGGSECADYMAHTLHQHVARFAIQAQITIFQDLKFIMADVFKAADEEFCSAFPDNSSGACAAVALIYESEILVAHIGDCRVILRCNNKTIRLTRDHRASDDDEMRRVISSGGEVVNGRLGGVMSPTRSFGDADVREEWGEGILISEPDVTYATLEKDTESRPQSSVSSSPLSTSSGSSNVVFLLLGTDGIFDELTCDEVCKSVEFAIRRGEGRKAADKLTKLAVSKTLDDCSAALAIWMSPEPDTPQKVMMSRRFEMVDMLDDSERSPASSE